MCLPPRIYRLLCASCRRIYVSSVAVHIYSRSQPPRSCRDAYQFSDQKGLSREINISSTAPASSSSTRLNHPAPLSFFFPPSDSASDYVSGNRKTKGDDEGGGDDDDGGVLGSNATNFSRGRRRRDRRMDESRKNRASFGKYRAIKKAGGHEKRLNGELSCKTKISIDPEEGLRALIWQDGA